MLTSDWDEGPTLKTKSMSEVTWCSKNLLFYFFAWEYETCFNTLELTDLKDSIGIQSILNQNQVVSYFLRKVVIRKVKRLCKHLPVALSNKVISEKKNSSCGKILQTCQPIIILATSAIHLITVVPVCLLGLT